MASTVLASAFDQVASRLFERVPDDVLVGAFHDAGSDRQPERPVEVVAHSIHVGLVGADAGRGGFGQTKQACRFTPTAAVPESRS